MRTCPQHSKRDIDLVVISEAFASRGYWERMGVLSATISTVFRPIETVAMIPEEWQSGNSLTADYAGNGEVVYG